MKRAVALILAWTGILGMGAGTALAQQDVLDPFRARRTPPGGRGPGVIASGEYVNTPITTVFRMISDLTGWSIAMSPDVSQRPPKINLWIKNLTPEQVLDEVAVLAELVLERKGNTIKVISFDEYVRIYGVEKRVVGLKHASAKDVIEILKPFAGKADQARILADESGSKIVLLVPKPLLASLARLIKAIDVPLEEDTIKIVRLKHLEAPVIVLVLEAFLVDLSEPTRSVPGTKATRRAARIGTGSRHSLRFMVEARLNVLVLRGPAKEVAKASKLIEQLDVPSDIKVVPYQMKFTTAGEVYATLTEVLGGDLTAAGHGGVPRRLRIALSVQNNQIVVEGSAADHRRIAKVIKAIDRPMPPGSGGIRVYRLENASADEVGRVLQNLIEERTKYAPESKEEKTPKEQRIHRVGAPGDEGVSGVKPPEKAPAPAEQTGISAESGYVIPPRVTQAPEINAVIVRASAADHEEFAQLIRELDRPRDQVMLEVTLVSVQSTDDFALGLELGAARIGGSGAQTIGFTTFGIGTVDPTTGAITTTSPPPFGLSYALFHSDDYSLVLNALRTVGQTRITSSPKILVEDNAEAEISQVTQEPFEIVNQGETTTTTSFGGFVDAGTVLTVVPHLSEANWLRLQYEVHLSSFGLRENPALPPPRRQNVVRGIVRIPADYTVVLGGLVSTQEDESVAGVPGLADIPLLGELFKNRTRDVVNQTLYVFIRPVILRDPAFRDLRHLSQADVKAAKLRQKDYPVNPLKTFSAGLPVGKESGT